MTIEQDTQHIGGSRRKWLPFSSSLALASLIAFAALMHSASAVIAVVLLSLSIWLDYFVVREQRPDSRLGNELALCEFFKVPLLWAYVLFDRRIWTAREGAITASGVALLLALLVTVGMIKTAAAMILRRGIPRRRRHIFLRGSMEELFNDKVLALTGVLIAFLHVTYFLSFALAFSDRFVTQNLWAGRLGEAEPTKKSEGPRSTGGPPHCQPADADRVRKFFFVQSAATLACTEELCAVTDNDPSLRKPVCNGGIASRISALEKVALPTCNQPMDPLHRRAAAWNVHELYELRALFRELAAGPDGGSYLVEVRGHANDTKLKADPAVAYGSNYEISKQRADQVALILSSALRQATQGLEEPSVRWLAYGVSNEGSFLDAKPENWADSEPLEPKLSVEVRILTVAESFEDRHLRATQSHVLAARSQSRELDLTDYLYFTVYTITTTGYGDIIPTGSYSKLIVTLANLIELLFVVVLVNVIANARLEGGDRPSSGEAAPGDDHHATSN